MFKKPLSFVFVFTLSYAIMQRMKIAYIITRMDEYGGAQVHIRDMSTYLQGQGHEITVLSGWPGKVSDFIEHVGVTYREIPDLIRSIKPKQDWRAFKQIRKTLQHEKPDIVSCHSSKAGLLGRLAARSLGIPVVFTAHGWAFTDNVPPLQRLIYRVIETLAALFTSRIITVSEYDRQLALKKHVCSTKKIKTVHNGMLLLPAPHRSVTEKDKPLQIIMVARFGPQKDHATLLRALSVVKSTKWHLTFVGGGDNSETGNLADKLGLSDKITFMGEREDIPEILESADLYTLITNWEGFPRSILEAMRAQLPVVATDVAGVSEAVIEGETGWLVPHRDEDALAAIIATAIENRQQVYDMGLAGRTRFEENFTFKHMMDKNLALYQEVVLEEG